MTTRDPFEVHTGDRKQNERQNDACDDGFATAANSPSFPKAQQIAREAERLARTKNNRAVPRLADATNAYLAVIPAMNAKYDDAVHGAQNSMNTAKR